MPKYKFSPKQKDVIFKTINNKIGFINISEGSVRSGKTFCFNLAWILYVLQSQHNKFLMSGESTDSLYRNVIGDMIYILGRNRATYQDSAKGGAQLIIRFDGKTKICYCRGANKANDEGKIRGLTIGGWYADEITLHHETFTKQALSRMSLLGAKAFWTTNPDTPTHYIKTDYIDKSEKNGYCHWHFTLDDNLSLPEEYKENIKNAYTGVFYDRFIRGLWIPADGLIYDCFNDSLKAPTVPRDYEEYYVSCDYGTQNATVFLLWGLYHGVWYLIDEYYYSGRDENAQKDDEQYYGDMDKFIDGRPVQAIIIDPSAENYITYIRNKGKYRALKANNVVLKGIRQTASCLHRGILKFNECCKHTFLEFASYRWDTKATEQGEDKPLKQDDHCMDAVRYFVVNVVMRNRKPYDDSVYSKGKSNNVTDEINTLLKYGNVF